MRVSLLSLSLLSPNVCVFRMYKQTNVIDLFTRRELAGQGRATKKVSEEGEEEEEKKVT